MILHIAAGLIVVRVSHSVGFPIAYHVNGIPTSVSLARYGKDG